MKNKYIILSSFLLISLFSYKPNENIVIASTSYVIETNGCSSHSLPTYLDLNRCSEDEIRAYYSSLNTLDDSNKSGINSLQYLKDILYEMNYYTYAQVSDIYSITDRDWVHSPTLTSGTYDALTNTVTSFNAGNEADTNPYITMLYVDYSLVETTPLKNSSNNANFDKEHVWCQSRGFKASSGAKGPAGTDLHHLIAGDSNVNQQIHNNNPYGYVLNALGQGNKEYSKENIKGSIKHTSINDQSDTVFEPADEWKGDIARAIFYMMARYNNVANKTGIIGDYEPNLEIVNYATSNGASITSSDTTTATIGILSDLLAWNKLDPVSDYEIYRNDLIYRNYQGNRNPFIDFPQWIDAIWGTASEDGTNYNSTPIGYLDPINDKINGIDESILKVDNSNVVLEVNSTINLKATTTSTSNITWKVNDSSIISIDKESTISNEEITINALSSGNTTIKVSIIDEDKEYSKTINVVVKDITPPKDDDENNIEEIDIKTIAIEILSALVFMIILYICYSSKKKSKKKRKTKNGKKK